MKTVIEMAREVGFTPSRQEPLFLEMLEQFVALVRADERERFALECIDLVAFHGGPVDLEAAIRARGNT